MSLVAGKLKAWLRFGRSRSLVAENRWQARFVVASCRKGKEQNGTKRNETKRKGRIGQQERKERSWSGENEPLNCAITLRLFVGRRVGIKMWPLPRRWRVRPRVRSRLEDAQRERRASMDAPEGEG